MKNQQLTNTKQLVSDLIQLRHKLEPYFSERTRAPGFVGNTSSTGHCAVVSLIAYFRYGGELISTSINGKSHWLNRFRIDSRCIDIDLTADQFGYTSVTTSMAEPLYSQITVRNLNQVSPETLLRAKCLAEQASLKDVSRQIEEILTSSK